MTRYYFCTVLDGVSTDAIDSSFPVNEQIVASCCTTMHGTIGASTATNVSIDGIDPGINAGTMGCGFSAPDALPGSTTAPAEARWGGCVSEEGSGASSVSCIMSMGGSLVNAMPFNDTSSSTTSSQAASNTAADTATTAATGKTTKATAGAVSNRIGTGAVAFIVASLAVSLLCVA